MLIKADEFASAYDVSMRTLYVLKNYDKKNKNYERFKVVNGRLFVDYEAFFKVENEINEARDLYCLIMDDFKNEWQMAGYFAKKIGAKQVNLYNMFRNFTFYGNNKSHSKKRDALIKAFKEYLKDLK